MYRGSNMDPTHYDKIADALIQFHSKLPEPAVLEWEIGKYQCHDVKVAIDILLKNIDVLANIDAKGYLR